MLTCNRPSRASRARPPARTDSTTASNAVRVAPRRAVDPIAETAETARDDVDPGLLRGGWTLLFRSRPASSAASGSAWIDRVDWPVPPQCRSPVTEAGKVMIILVGTLVSSRTIRLNEAIGLDVDQASFHGAFPQLGSAGQPAARRRRARSVRSLLSASGSTAGVAASTGPDRRPPRRTSQPCARPGHGGIRVRAAALPARRASTRWP